MKLLFARRGAHRAGSIGARTDGGTGRSGASTRARSSGSRTLRAARCRRRRGPGESSNADTGDDVAALPGRERHCTDRRGDALAAGHDEIEGASSRASCASRRGHVAFVADTAAFEAAVEPADDGTDEGSNPFDLARLGGGKTLVADAGGNSLLYVDEQGRIDWVATFPARTDIACLAWVLRGDRSAFPVHAVRDVRSRSAQTARTTSAS